MHIWLEIRTVGQRRKYFSISLSPDSTVYENIWGMEKKEAWLLLAQLYNFYLFVIKRFAINYYVFQFYSWINDGLCQ